MKLIRSVANQLVLCLLLLFVMTAQAQQDIRISVQLDGVPEGQMDALLSGLSIVRQQSSPRLTQRQVEKLDQQALTELSQMLTVFGYYNPMIISDLKKMDAGWQAHYQITLGPQVILKAVNVTLLGEANDDPKFQALLADFPLKKAEALDHQDYEAAKKILTRLAADRGYFDGKMTKNTIEVNTEENTATITLEYNSYQRYRFDDIQFPDTTVSEDVLQRVNPIAFDSPFLVSKIVSLRNNLINSGYFDVATVTPLIEQRHDGKVKLDIALTPVAKHRYTAGLGFGTDSGARGSLGWENRYINKRGHRLSADAKLSQVKNSLAMAYKMPFWSPTISEVGFNTELKQSDTDTSDSQSLALGSYYQSTRWGWKETASLKLLHENFDVSQDDNTSTLLIPSIGWSRTWADNTIYTKQGGRLSLSISAASESLLSDTSFIQAVLRGKYIQSLSENSRVITRAALGATEVTDFNQLPSSLRFFAGGDTSIRGFDFEELGPKGSDGSVEGGRYLAVGSVEYEQMFWGNWGGAVFTDFGNAMNSWRDPIEYSVGFGVRWRSPIGLIRVDIAQGISEPDKPIGFHIVIGPDL
ncbi:MAG: autotransporter assembly complex protein TamA [Gammaproteobacteria bacterium]|nr:autotransporter assembly complex protein TamA [Gammaproteobacteria bacterium]